MGCRPAGSFVPPGSGTERPSGICCCPPARPWLPAPSTLQASSGCWPGRGTGVGFSAAGAVVLSSILLRQCRPFHGPQSGLDQALHGCGPCAFQNCVHLYLDPNGGTRDELSSNNPWQEGQNRAGKDFCPIIGYSEEGIHAPF